MVVIKTGEFPKLPVGSKRLLLQTLLTKELV